MDFKKEDTKPKSTKVKGEFKKCKLKVPKYKLEFDLRPDRLFEDFFEEIFNGLGMGTVIEADDETKIITLLAMEEDVVIPDDAIKQVILLAVNLLGINKVLFNYVGNETILITPRMSDGSMPVKLECIRSVGYFLDEEQKTITLRNSDGEFVQCIKTKIGLHELTIDGHWAVIRKPHENTFFNFSLVDDEFKLTYSTDGIVEHTVNYATLKRYGIYHELMGAFKVISNM